MIRDRIVSDLSGGSRRNPDSSLRSVRRGTESGDGVPLDGEGQTRKQTVGCRICAFHQDGLRVVLESATKDLHRDRSRAERGVVRGNDAGAGKMPQLPKS